MSFARSLTLARVARRSYSTAAEGGDYFAERAAVKAHAAETTELWRKISFYVCAPIILVGSIYVKRAEDAHHAHLHEHGRHEPPNYQYLNKREKPFPWGMNTLFWNPETQKDMSKSE
ncbi:hypothetical protein RSOLAG22IIIB_06381 [Rhizoctonia solani]|uniref:Cytochrome c oxidase subunit 6A, mitochondrial n=1 Tax=Rhizoctonia solani TaxID=456999 RepID=A0A0K6FQB8_9AGAM|nr:hypothetical protein RSOLAG22IIIB_13740 [Rhizoctonia solani]CUA76620.1 hypothetical protein RSOLAG22IIIB_06381 [Rhizoctonia solani]